MVVGVLELTYDFNGQRTVLHPVLIQDGDAAWLVDCGYEGSMEQIREQLLLHGLDLADLTGIVITHDDIDHLGALHEIKQAYPAVRIICPEKEAPYISGERKSKRLEQAEEILEKLPDDQKAWASAFCESLRAIRRVKVDTLLSLEDDLASGVRIIQTPGHTPGHISIYIPQLSVLITADAIVVEDGILNIANPGYCLDLKEAVKSVKKLAALQIDKMICYHGGVVEGDISGKIRALISRYDQA